MYNQEEKLYNLSNASLSLQAQKALIGLQEEETS
jgi:hypothetical protein